MRSSSSVSGRNLGFISLASFLLLNFVQDCSGQLSFSEQHCDVANIKTFTDNICYKTDDATQDTEGLCLSDGSDFRAGSGSAEYFPYYTSD
eukprot:Awhi_evm1s7878